MSEFGNEDNLVLHEKILLFFVRAEFRRLQDIINHVQNLDRVGQESVASLSDGQVIFAINILISDGLLERITEDQEDYLRLTTDGRDYLSRTLKTLPMFISRKFIEDLRNKGLDDMAESAERRNAALLDPSQPKRNIVSRLIQRILPQ